MCLGIPSATRAPCAAEGSFQAWKATRVRTSRLALLSGSTINSSLNIAGTLTGTTINALINLQEEGISLSSKYFQLSTFITNATEKQYPPSAFSSYTASTATT